MMPPEASTKEWVAIVPGTPIKVTRTHELNEPIFKGPHAGRLKAIFRSTGKTYHKIIPINMIFKTDEKWR